MPRVAVYLRQSLDQDAGLAVDRQRENCLRMLEARGWEVEDGHVYTDNSVSATSKKPRPAYLRMLAAMKAGQVDHVFAWNLDRLNRNPRELEDWIDLCMARSVSFTTSEGEFDARSEAGRLHLRVLSSFARMEVERKSRRQKESNEQGRALGVPPSGRRAFGYTARIAAAKGVTATRTAADGQTWPDYGHEPVEEEATLLRRAFDLMLAGGTLYGIAREWNEAGAQTTSGARWSPITVRNVLASPRYAGLVRPARQADAPAWSVTAYRLDELTPGTWEPIVSVETWTAVQQLLRDPSRRTSPGQQRKYLLSGLATCGVLVDGKPCGTLVKASRTNKGLRAYACRAGFHLTRQAEVVDDLVVELTLRRLARPDAAHLLERRDVPDVSALRSEYAAKRAMRDQLADLYAEGIVTAAGLRSTSKKLKAEMVALQERMSDAGRVDILGPLVGADDLRATWDGLTVEVQRAVIGALMSVALRSPGVGARRPRDRDAALAKTAETVDIAWVEG